MTGPPKHRIGTFLSTLSLRRATVFVICTPWGTGYFYPRSPCGERHEYCSVAWLDYSISIHALLAESDLPINVMSVSAVQISIHALLAESDILGNAVAGLRM